MTEDDVDRIIEKYDSESEFRISEAYPDGGTGMLSGRLHRAALNQIELGAATFSRYAIWANTVRDHIVAAERAMTAGDLEESRRLLYSAANSLSAFSDIQAVYE